MLDINKTEVPVILPAVEEAIGPAYKLSTKTL
jgi:hypothetical protein